MPVVTVEWLAGRSKEQRAELAKAITDAVVKIAKANPDGVTVVFKDVPRDYWSKAGKLMSEP